MLGKLFKYEFKAMGRVMLPLYLVMIFIAGVFSLNIKSGMGKSAQTLLQRFAIIVGVLFLVAVMAAVVVMVILVIQRFYKNLLGSEGYLMFTLPVTTLQQIVSKALSALVWILIGIGAGIAAGFVMVGIVSDVPEFLRELRQVWDLFVGNESAAQRVIVGLILLILSILESLLNVYAAMAVGHQANSHRILYSILAYIGFGIIEVIIASSPIGANLISAGSRLVETRAGDAMVVFNMGAAAPMAIISLIQIAVYGFITWYLLDRRLNLE